MTWIRVETNVGDSDKVHQLAHALNVNVAAAVGHLVMLWGAVADHRVDGDLAGVLDTTIEMWAGWRGRHGRFAARFRPLFMDGDILHGWGERQGKLILRQIADRLRKGGGNSEELLRKGRGGSGEVPALRDGTIRNGESTTKSAAHAAGRDMRS